jgi:transposase
VVAADDKVAVGLMLSGGNAADGPQGRGLLSRLGRATEGAWLLMDRAYEGRATRGFAESLGYRPVVPPKRNRRTPWAYDEELYKKRDEVERFFADTNASGGSARATTSSTACLRCLSTWDSSTMLYISVNKP